MQYRTLNPYNVNYLTYLSTSFSTNLHKIISYFTDYSKVKCVEVLPRPAAQLFGEITLITLNINVSYYWPVIFNMLLNWLQKGHKYIVSMYKIQGCLVVYIMAFLSQTRRSAIIKNVFQTIAFFSVLLQHFFVQRLQLRMKTHKQIPYLIQ